MTRKQVALAKISRPRLHDVLVRARLHRELDRACERPVVWLCAQPGAGKTTLIASYLAAKQRPEIWYQLDATDVDPASFIYHLRLAAGALGTAPASDPLPLLTPEYLPDLQGFSRRFFRELFLRIGADAALVLDNFQDVPEASAFHHVVAEGLEHLPDGLNVFVASRAEPPPRYGSLMAGDAIALVDGEQLRMTIAETKAVARKRGVDDEGFIASLQERSHGWAAGLTLLLARTQRDAHRDDSAESLQHVFGYFAQRVFDGTPLEQRRALAALSFVPSITIALAERLTGLADVGRLLEHFYKRRLFIDRRRIAAPSTAALPSILAYQYHALFRTFLQHQALGLFGADEIRDIRFRAAALLDDAGQWEHALDLFADAGDWNAYTRALVRRIESLLDQGRVRTVADTLRRIPNDVRADDPWLGYWQGRASMQVAPDDALQLFRATHERFMASGDAAGRIACGAAIVETLWYARLGWSEVTPWVDGLETLMHVDVEFPTAAMELASYSSLHSALAFCRPAHPALGPIATKLMGLVDDPSLAWNQRLFTATGLITYFHNAAAHDLATQLIAKVDAVIDTMPSSALARAFWLIFRAIHDIREAKHAEAAQGFQRAEDLAVQEGLRQVEYVALQFRAYLELLFHRTEEAEARLARMEVHPARSSRDAEMHLYTLQTLLAQQRGDVPTAVDRAERALEAIERVGAAYFQAVFPPLVASAFADAGHVERALAIIDRARRWSQGSYLEAMEAQLLLEEAYMHLVGGDGATARAKLAEGLRLAAGHATRLAYVHRIVARKPALLVMALKDGIEVDLVRRLIRRWRIPPPDEEIALWPWPVKIFTLAGANVLVHDRPIEFGRKAPKKTLALLKAIVASGGSAPEGTLIDAFWPDEEGDAAARSLAGAVHRLRVLLGEGDAIVQQAGVLSIDRALVWVDAWAFERGLACRASPREVDAALALYRGAFLTEETDGWAVTMRERLRSRFIQAVADRAQTLESEGSDEDAIALYLRGLEADSVVEPFYQGLMRCYQRLDRLPEAVSVYRRLKQILSITLGLPPSAATDRLYQSLRPR